MRGTTTPDVEQSSRAGQSAEEIKESMFSLGPELSVVQGTDPDEEKVPRAPNLKGVLATNERIATKEYMLYSEAVIVVPPRTKATVWLAAPKRLLNYKGTVCTSPPPDGAAFSSRLIVAHGIDEIQNGKVAVQLMNLHYTEDSIPSMVPVAKFTFDEIEVAGW